MSVEVIVCFDSTAQAILAERLLGEQALAVRVMPKPAALEGGCGFCLRFLPEETPKALAFLVDRAIPVGKIYTREESEHGVSYQPFTSNSA